MGFGLFFVSKLPAVARGNKMFPPRPRQPAVARGNKDVPTPTAPACCRSWQRGCYHPARGSLIALRHLPRLSVFRANPFDPLYPHSIKKENPLPVQARGFNCFLYFNNHNRSHSHNRMRESCAWAWA